MNRSPLEPLGVPSTQYTENRSASRGWSRGSAPTGFDRWLLQQLTDGIGDAPIRLQLWDLPLAEQPSEAVAVVRIADRAALMQLLINPELHFGDLYSAGRIDVAGNLLTVIEIAYRYVERRKPNHKWRTRVRRLPAPDVLQSRRNIHHHYDIGNDFYRLWLDQQALQYTCAYYADKSMTIEQAQQAKMHHVCRKVWLKADDEVVEAGSGWGGFALFMAKHYGAKVRSFNISKEQVAYAREWAQREGLANRVEFIEDDYRNISGQHDVFVSIGMLEHVGAGNYVELGQVMNRALRSEGRGLIHTIGRDRTGTLNAWIDRRIFPGAYPPTLLEMMSIFEPNGFSVLDAENLRLHYAKTLEAWLERYETEVDAVRNMFDEAFVRAWRLYLTGSIGAFLTGSLQLFQVAFARSGVNNIPWTREHIYR
jgi:cyclopropane-fatty-acyl-phospholipid synthase